MKGTKDTQLLVRGLSGRTHCIQFQSSTLKACELSAKLEVLEGVPVSSQRILCGSKNVGDDFNLVADASGNFPSCALLLRLVGGKGGFGSLLRGAAKSGKHVENNDACRDLSGRRLRHVNAEKKLKNWAKEDDERELERIAQEHMKKVAAQEKKDNETNELTKTWIGEIKKNEGKVVNSVQSGLIEAKVKRKQAEDEAEARKRQCMWGIPEDSDSDSDSDDEEGGAGPAGAGPSGSGKGAPMCPADAKGKGKVGEGSKDTAGPSTSSSPSRPATPEDTTEGGPRAGAESTLDLSAIPSAGALEKLGMERLKAELTKHGLKCGGSLKERAERLFLLASTPVDKLDRKHFSQPPVAGKKK